MQGPWRMTDQHAVAAGGSNAAGIVREAVLLWSWEAIRSGSCQ